MIFEIIFKISLYICIKQLVMYNDSNIAINSLAVLTPEKEPRRYTLAEYLRREERSQELHEYYNGIITKLPMARGPHNEIVANIIFALKNSFKSQKTKYRVFSAQQLVYLPELNYSLYPDVLVVVEEPQYWDNNEVLLINPILIVEVLSKSTKKYDRGAKFVEYKTLESFKEYVLIDPNSCHIETHFREEPNLWRDNKYTDLSGSLHLKSVDCSVDLSDIYANIVFK
jgi:Uma2 family endonuclease